MGPGPRYVFRTESDGTCTIVLLHHKQDIKDAEAIAVVDWHNEAAELLVDRANSFIGTALALTDGTHTGQAVRP